ncbi:hypothetical protein GCM10017744_007900 [Streptomyces antimycoticus]
METQAKFADTIYTHADRSLLVNLFIPSELRWQDKGITWRQTTGFPDQQTTTLTVPPPAVPPSNCASASPPGRRGPAPRSTAPPSPTGRPPAAG